MDLCRLLWKDSESFAAAWWAVLAARETAVSNSPIVLLAWAAVLRCSWWMPIVSAQLLSADSSTVG